MKEIIKEIILGGKKIVLETGHIARQATAAVMVSMEGTQVLVTLVAQPEPKPGADFFGLTVNYYEKMFAAGLFPGGYFKREGKPSEQEILTARLIDRAMRPLFPKGFYNEVQVVCTVLSLNPKVQPDMLAMIGTSAALALSGLPTEGTFAGVRVGYQDGVYLVNPSTEEMADTKLDLVVAGTQEAVLMVESEAEELSEEAMLGAVTYGHEMLQGIVSSIDELSKAHAKPRWTWEAPAENIALKGAIEEKFSQSITEAYQIPEKTERQSRLAELREQLIASFINNENEDTLGNEDELKALFSQLEKRIVRQRIMDGEPRIDGRDRKTVRPIFIKPSFLERTHGSVLFTRGETQALVVATLGTDRNAQEIDSIHGPKKDHYTLHYNFPPYCVGETGMMTGPKRREIGHGRLARRATEWMLPSKQDFPYSVRIVSEITESNGSSSMASVCGASLALMDAGVKIKAPVAGIAMGLIKESDRYAVLTDILGDEDHLGDMDFKVAGTRKGVTALQMDIKVTGINKSIMQEALDQALEARLHILDLMNKAMPAAREVMSPYAPKVVSMKVNAEKIKDVIGKGGATIRGLTEKYNVNIDIEDDGTIRIYASDQASVDSVKKEITMLTTDVKVDSIYEGTVSRIVDFGAFVNILPGRDGLVHISQIAHERIDNVKDWLKEGEMVRVKVIDIDRQGKIKLSMKVLIDKAEKEQEAAS